MREFKEDDNVKQFKAGVRLDIELTLSPEGGCRTEIRSSATF